MMNSAYSAAALYGGPPAPVASPTPVMDHAPGTPEPTHGIPTAGLGPLGNPTFALVALLAVAVLLVQVSVRFGISVEA